jgi:carboxylesterase
MTDEGVAVSVRPGAEPYSAEGDEFGVLLCHGFTGSPVSMRPWAEYLADAGHTVRVPLLPGHGTTWKDLNRTRWTDWYGEVDRAFTDLRDRCRTVTVAGLSMGGALALRLAEQYPAEGGRGVDGLVLVNPAVQVEGRSQLALPVMRWVLPSIPPIGDDIKRPGISEQAYTRVPLHAAHSMMALYRQVVADLPQVRQPLLLFRSAEDHVVPASSSALVLQRVSSAVRREQVCAESYHVATLDNDAPMIFEETLRFVERIAGPVGGASG